MIICSLPLPPRLPHLMFFTPRLQSPRKRATLLAYLYRSETALCDPKVGLMETWLLIFIVDLEVAAEIYAGPGLTLTYYQVALVRSILKETKGN